MVARRGTYIGTIPVAGTGRINFASTSSGPDRQVGDELYIIAMATDTGISNVPTFGSTPAGWTKLDEQSNGSDTRFALFTKISDGTEGTVDITATTTGTINVAVSAVSITGATRNAGILGSGSISTTTWNTADVTTTEDYSHVFAFTAARTNGSFAPTDCIEHIDTTAGSSIIRLGVFEQMTKDPGTRDLEGTISGSTTTAWAFVVVMEPDSATFSDDFNRTAEDPLSDSGQWAQFSGLTSQQVLTNGTQALGFSSTLSANAAYRNHIWERDYQIEGTLATKGANFDLFSLFLRINNPASASFNAIEMRHETLSGTDLIRFYRWVGGSASLMTGASVNQEVAAGEKLRFTAVGTHYKAELYTGGSWTTVLEFVDTGSVVTRGHPAIRIGGTTARVDDISGAAVEADTAEYVHAVTSGGSLTAASTNNITLPIAYPGDAYILNVRTLKTVAGDISVAIPGFTEFGSYLNGNHEHFLFYRICDGTEGAHDTATIVKVATATGSNPGSTRWRTGAITVICDDTDIFRVDPFNENEEASSTTWQTDSISQTAGDLLVVWVNHDGTNTNSSTSDDAAAVETQDSASNSSGTHVAVYIKRITSTASDDMTGTLSGANAKRTFIYTIKAPVLGDITEDSDTITLTLTVSAAEVMEAVEASTTTLTLTPTFDEEYETAGVYEDSGTITLVLTDSFVEEYTQIYTDSGTVTLTLTAGGTEYKEHPIEDTGTVTMKLQGVMAPPHPLLAPLIDDFERASLGSDWDILASMASGPQIYGSSDYGNSVGGPRGAYYNVETFNTSDEIITWVKVSTLPGAIFDSVGPFMSPNPSAIGWDGYLAYWFAPSSTGGTMSLLRSTVSNVQSIDYLPGVTLLVGDYVVLQRMAGSTGELRVWRYRPSDDSWFYCAGGTHSSYTGDMYLGIRQDYSVGRVEEFGGGIANIIEDSGEITLTLTAELTEDWLPATGGYEDVGTIPLDLAPSVTVEILETVDADTIPLLLTATLLEDYPFTENLTFYLDLDPSESEELQADEYTDSQVTYFYLSPTGADELHTCKGRFRGTLLTWTYDPDGMYAHWSSLFYGSTWRGELLPVEAVVNYAC